MIVKTLCSMLICFCISLFPLVGYCDDFTTGSAVEPLDVVIVDDLRANNLTLDQVTVSNQRITANDTSGLKSIMLSLIGDYETTVTDYVYNNGSYQSHSINVERDWSWIMTCGLFIVVVYCTFRAVGGILWK